MKEGTRTIIVATNLLYVLLLGMGDDLGNEDGKNVFEELHSERHASPVVTLLHDVKNVTYYMLRVSQKVGGRARARTGDTHR